MALRRMPPRGCILRLGGRLLRTRDQSIDSDPLMITKRDGGSSVLRTQPHKEWFKTDDALSARREKASEGNCCGCRGLASLCKMFHACSVYMPPLCL